MLYPIENRTRNLKSLDGIWCVKYDPDHVGFEEHYLSHIPDGVEEVAVPASLNELSVDRQQYLNMDWVWCFTRFFYAPSFNKGRVLLRFGAVSFRAEVFLNGVRLGDHEGGYLPFEFELEADVLKSGDNLLVVRIDSLLDHTTIPQGNLPDLGGVSGWRVGNLPNVHYDFFPFTGIHRSVALYSVPQNRIRRVWLTTLSTEGTGAARKVRCRVNVETQGDSGTLWVRIPEMNVEVGLGLTCRQGSGCVEGTMELSSVQLWCPEHPKLYEVELEYRIGDDVQDCYALPFGFRTVEITEGVLRLNGERIFLRGFGKHEDLTVIGKGLNFPFMIKDFNLLRWIGANSFRTSHYPYSEEMMRMADRWGVLVIDEAAANTLSLEAVANPEDRQRLFKNHQDHITDLINRDYNHACVILWSLGNECETYREAGRGYFRELVAHAKSLDSSRPVFFVVNSWGCDDLEADCFDLIAINAYPCWYQGPGDLEHYLEEGFRKQVDIWHQLYPDKPVMITECGADAIPGLRDEHVLMWTEDYQVELLSRILDLVEQRSWIQGFHPWNFADFKVGQHATRVAYNWKGVFTRERHPKSAAYLLKRRWSE